MQRSVGKTPIRYAAEQTLIKDKGSVKFTMKEQSSGESENEDQLNKPPSRQCQNSISAIPPHYINIGSLYNEWNAARLHFNMTHPEFAACLLHLLKNTLHLLPLAMQPSVPVGSSIFDWNASREALNRQISPAQRSNSSSYNNSHQTRTSCENTYRNCNAQKNIHRNSDVLNLITDEVKSETEEENYANINPLRDLPLSIKLEVGDLEKVDWVCQANQSILPDPENATTPQEAAGICSANNEVEVLLAHNGQSDKRRKRGNYRTYSAEIRARIAKHAIEKGNASAVRHFSMILGRPVSESTVRYIKASYLEKTVLLQLLGKTFLKQLLFLTQETLSSCKQARTIQGDITNLPHKSRGRPTLLGDYENEVRNYIQELRGNGGVVNGSVVLAAAHGIMKARAPHLLAEHGGNLNLSRHWAASILERMGIN